jgi:V/A-type H+-transporting ATPase subunit E
MADLDKLKARILEDARGEAGRTLAVAREEAELALAEARERATAESREILAEAEAEAADMMRRGRSEAALSKRMALLAARREAVDEAFAKALASIRSMPAKEYFDAIAVRIRTVRSGKDGVVLLSTADLARAPKDFVAEFSPGDGGTLLRDGFMLREGDVVTDGTFETELRMRRGELEPEAVRLLFDEKP